MRITFLSFGQISRHPGHLARLISVLPSLNRLNEITIICCGGKADTLKTVHKYPGVKFVHHPIKLRGWEIENLKVTVAELEVIIKNSKPEITVMMMEVWDLVRELGQLMENVNKFAVVMHAMPFLTSPIEPSNSFEDDVINYLKSGIEVYRQDYIKSHFKEARMVLPKTNIIAANKTVKYYLNSYFPNLKIWEFSEFVDQSIDLPSNIRSHVIKYDFAYMARMEKDKGVEQLYKIMTEISKLLGRKVRLVILGKTDDKYSNLALDNLAKRQSEGKYELNYLGWADEEIKANILLKSGVFLYPSSYDNFPGVVVEALTYGMPVIAWDVPWSRLNYPDLAFFKKVKLGNCEEFALMSVKMLNDRYKYSKMALKYVESFPLPDEVARKDTKLFRLIGDEE